MKDDIKNRNHWLHIRLTEAEKRKIDLGFNQSASQKRSEYVRHVLLEKPITILQRNKSIDDFTAEIILLKSELNSIGKNFNQVVKKLHNCSHDAEIKAWALLNENNKDIIIKKIGEIQQKINHIAAQW